MRAIVYNLNIPKYLLTKLITKIYPKKFFSSLSCINLKDFTFPKRPNENWLKIKTTMSGICGSDINAIMGKESFSMEPYSSFPCILGHENIGTIEMTCSSLNDFNIGDRVIVEPILSCDTRNVDPCPECRSGNYSLCSNFATKTDVLPPGLIIGFNKSTSGGWGEYFWAHKNHVFKIPDEVSDESAVLVDSIASAFQPVANHLPPDSSTVLVYGCGILGINTILSLRALGFKGKIIAIYKYSNQGQLAKEKGADHLINKNIFGEVIKITGGRVIKNSIGKPTIEGGVDLVFDCIGASETIDNSLRLTRAKGKIVLIATTGQTNKIDFCPVWFKEITLIGSSMYSYCMYEGEKWRTYELVMKLINEKKINTHNLISHFFELHNWKKAIRTALDKKKYLSMKIVFKFS